MCNSYSNGQCLYYGVKVSELNNKCDRGDCMTKEEQERKEYEEINGIIERIANKSEKMYTEEELEKLMNNRAYHA